MPAPTDPKEHEMWLLRQSASHIGQIAHNKGVPCSEQQKKDISIALTGLKQSDETKEKRSKALKGRVLTPEHKEKIRLASIKRWEKK